MIAVKLIQSQGIDVTALAFVSNFFGNTEKLKLQAETNGFPLKIMDVKQDYLNVIKKPKHGFGKNYNPCIDCKIFMLTQAREYAESVGAHFLFTGEVLGQRPMSQRRDTLGIIMRESGLEGKLLRPLCAQNLPPTEAESEGWVDRDRLLGIQGRSRKHQLALSEELGLKNTQSPGGGCLLAEREYTKRLKELIDAEGLAPDNIALIKKGRFHRHENTIIVLGRNHEQNQALTLSAQPEDSLMEVVDHMGPTTLIRGPKTEEALQKAALLTAKYSKAPEGEIKLKYGNKEKMRSFRVTNRFETN